MLKPSLKNLLLSVFALALISCSVPPTYSRQDISEVIKKICKNEYGMEVNAWLVDETLWVHAPIKLFDESGKLKINEEGKADEDLSESLRKISQSIQRALLNMDSPPIFYCLIKSDIQRLGGIDLIRMNHYELVFVPDQIKLTLGTYGLATLISTKEFENRIILMQAPFIANKLLKDNYGRRIDKYNIPLSEFISLLTHQRIFNAFSLPEIKDNFEINNIEVKYKRRMLEVNFDIRIKKYKEKIPVPLKRIEEIVQKTLDSYSSFIDIQKAQINDKFAEESKTLSVESSGSESERFSFAGSKTGIKHTLAELYRGSFYLMQAYQHSQGEEKNLKKAIRFYRQTLEAVPDYIYAYILLGETYMSLGRYQEALAVFNEAQRMDRKNPTVYYSLGECNRLLGDPRLAAKNFQLTFLLEPDYPGILEALSRIYADLGVSQESREYLTRAIEDMETKNSDNPEVYRSIGNIYTRLGQYSEALEYLKKAKELGGNHLATYVSLADLYRLMGKSQEAIFNFQRALTLDPGSTAAKLGLAHTYLALGQYRKAISRYQEILTQIPQSYDIYTALAQAHSGLGLEKKDSQEHEKALEYLKKALSLNSKSFEVYYLLGETYSNLDQHKKAIPYFKKALKLNLYSAQTHFGLGRAYFGLGQNEKAKQSFLNAHALFYEQGDQLNARKAEENMLSIP